LRLPDALLPLAPPELRPQVAFAQVRVGGGLRRVVMRVPALVAVRGEVALADLLLRRLLEAGEAASLLVLLVAGALHATILAATG
jgi:hypothetical protein